MIIEWDGHKIKVTDGDKEVAGIAEVHSNENEQDVLIRILDERLDAEIATLLIKDNVPKLEQH